MGLRRAGRSWPRCYISARVGHRAPPDASSARCLLRGAMLPRVARLLGGNSPYPHARNASAPSRRTSPCWPAAAVPVVHPPRAATALAAGMEWRHAGPDAPAASDSPLSKNPMGLRRVQLAQLGEPSSMPRMSTSPDTRPGSSSRREPPAKASPAPGAGGRPQCHPDPRARAAREGAPASEHLSG